MSERITKIEAYEIWLAVERPVNSKIADAVTDLARDKVYTDKRKLVVDALRMVADSIENMEIQP